MLDSLTANPNVRMVHVENSQHNTSEIHFDIPSQDPTVVETACQAVAVATVMLWKGDTQKSEQAVFVAHGIDCESRWVASNHWIGARFKDMQLDNNTTRYIGRSRANELSGIRAAYRSNQYPCRECGAIHNLGTKVCPTCAKTF